jgi:hypothetical protein
MAQGQADQKRGAEQQDNFNLVTREAKRMKVSEELHERSPLTR